MEGEMEGETEGDARQCKVDARRCKAMDASHLRIAKDEEALVGVEVLREARHVADDQRAQRQAIVLLRLRVKEVT